MTNDTIAFIGGGNMTRAIAGGLISGDYDASSVLIAEPFAEQRDMLRRDFPGVTVSTDNTEVAGQAGCLVLAVKPQVLAGVCAEIQGVVQQKRPLVVSIAAGIRSDDIDAWLGGGLSIVRVMPNQPALLRQGVSGIYANERVTEVEIAHAREIMTAVGQVVEVPQEDDIDAVTAISGSGPAYFFLLIDMMTVTARELGLDEAAASTLAIATAQGAAQLAAASDESMDNLIARVRSPGGTTAAALDSLEKQGVRDIFSRALTAARDRAIALADQAHEDAQS